MLDIGNGGTPHFQEAARSHFQPSCWKWRKSREAAFPDFQGHFRGHEGRPGQLDVADASSGRGEPQTRHLPPSFTDQASPAAPTHDKTYDEPFAMLYNVQRLSILTIAQPSPGITCACQTDARSHCDKSIRRAATCMPSSPIGARGYD
jgi:hypothetical protein